MYEHYFSNFGRPPVSDDIYKDSVTRHPRFWRKRFLKIFPIQMHREANFFFFFFFPGIYFILPVHLMCSGSGRAIPLTHLTIYLYSIV